MDKRTKRAVAAVAALLLIGAAAWALRGPAVDPAVAALEAQRDRVFSPEATDADRQAFRQQVEQLTEAQRRQLFERGRGDMQRRMRQRMNELFSLPPEELRREARQRAADVVAGRRARADEPDRGGPGGGPPWARGDMTDAQRDQRAKERLDFVDPGMRAQFSEFSKLINDELEAQGQEPLSGRDMRTLFRPPRG